MCVLYMCQMASNLMAQVQQLKLLIEQARQQSDTSHDSVIEMVRAQFEKEKNEVCLFVPVICSGWMGDNIVIHISWMWS